MINIESLHLEDRPFALDKYGPVFILGCPRSGTTFLSKCLAAIDDLEEFVGVLVPPRFMHLIGSTEDGEVKENMLLVTRDIFWQSFWRRRMFRYNKLTQVLQKNAPFRSLFQKPEMNGSIFCYKEPFLCFAAKDFANHYSNSKFIHIIRDGRDNADSMDRTYPFALSNEVLMDQDLTLNNNSEIGPWRRYKGFSIPWWVKPGEEESFINYSKYERNFLMWAEMVTRARELRQVVAKERYLEIRYEDFVQDPVKISHAILQFLGSESNPRVNAQLKKAFSSSIGINKKNSSEDKVRRAEKIAFPLLQELGYN